MTGLTDALRERLSRRGRTAEADCGALGVLTVEALSPGDCAALLRRGGKRAVLYAACRELQRSGEDLRREGRVYTPEEIMDYVSGSELSAAASAVLALSGVEDPESAGTGGTEEASPSPPSPMGSPPQTSGSVCGGESRRKRSGMDARQSRTEWSGVFDGEGVPTEADFAAEPGPGEAVPSSPVPHGAPAKAAAFVGSGGARERREECPPGCSDQSGLCDGAGEGRHEPVQKFKEAIPEIRHGFVRDGAGQSGREPDGGLSQSPEVRPGIVRERTGGPGPGADGAGQASREAGTPAAMFRPEAPVDKKTQAFVSGTENRTLNVAKVTGGPGVFRREASSPDGEPPAAAHESKSDFPEGTHEIESEFPPEGGGTAHETKSEFPEGAHETESELPPEGGGTAHETESDFGEGPHESKSGFPAEGGGTAHESKSDFPEGAHESKSESAGAAEMTAALAERAAEFLLEGLRRAAGAR